MKGRKHYHGIEFDREVLQIRREDQLVVDLALEIDEDPVAALIKKNIKRSKTNDVRVVYERIQRHYMNYMARNSGIRLLFRTPRECYVFLVSVIQDEDIKEATH